MECFIVYSDKIEGRIDPFYYKPEFIRFYQQVKRTKFEIKSIDEIAERITSGATPLSKGNAYTSKEEGIPFIRSGDINEDNKINFDEVLYVKRDIHDKLLRRSKLKKGDILIAIVGATIGQVSIYDFDKEANINQAIALVRLKEGINPEYVKAFMISALGQKQLDRIKRPVARANINLNEIGSIKIIMPPIAIQNRAVALMEKSYKELKNKEDRIDGFLESINDYVLNELGIKLPELKDKLSYIVNSNELEGKRVDPYYYQPKFKELEKAIENSKFGVVNVGTKLNILDKLEDINKYTYINYVDLSSVNKSLGLITNYNKLNPSEAPSRAKQKIEKGDLLLSGLSGSLKSIAVFDNSFDNAICSTGFYVIKSSENYNNYFLWALFRTDIFQLILQREASGAIMSAINREAFVNLKIPLPSLTIQNKIADEVKKRIEEAKRLQKEAEKELVNAKQEVEALILNS